MIYASLVTVTALMLYQVISFKVGRARSRYQIAPPQMTGPPGFERALRAQHNTLEQLMFFLPSLWLFSYYISDIWAGLLGSVWIAGRALYAQAYAQDASKRFPGFVIAMFAANVLWIGAFYAIVVKLWAANAIQ